jgi:hypothetical protein
MRRATAAGVLAAALAMWLLVVAQAWPTFLGMNPATGTVAALADASLHGRAPGADGGSTFLAALYTPPFPLVVARLHALGVGWRDALRIASVLSIILLLAATAWCVRAAGGRGTGTACACALLVASFPIQSATLAGRADGLAAALTLAAVAAWLGTPDLRSWKPPLLSALAWMTKITALTVPAAILLEAVRGRRIGPALRYLAGFAIGLAAALALMIPAHGPAWMASVTHAMLWARPNTTVLARGPAELLRYLASFAELAVIASLAIVGLATGGDRMGRLRMASLISLIIALAVMSNRGSDHNHLLELTALTAVSAGLFIERTLPTRAGEPLPPAAALAATLVVLAVAAGSWRNFDSVHRAAPRPESRRAGITARIAGAPGEVFTEDPLLALTAGRPAAVADPALLRSLAARGEPRALGIVDDLERGRWTMLVLESEPSLTSSWYRDFHLGPRATAALLQSYRETGQVDGYVVMERRP